MSPPRVALPALAVNLGITLLMAQLIGPAASKLDAQFGLVPWAARLPFYVLPLYIGIAVVWLRPAPAVGTTVGFALTFPLAVLSIATRCASAVTGAYLLAGPAEGFLLSWLMRQPKL